MARFTFEICQQEHVEELTNYIDTHWAKDHILVTSRELLDWQHKSKHGGYYNFVMARHNKSGEICGVLGFIPTSHFSEELESEKEVWLAIWKVDEGPKYVGLGLALLNYLKREFAIKNICSIGISQIVFPMYQTLGFQVGQLSQLALINSSLSKFSVAKVPSNFAQRNLMAESGYEVSVISEQLLMTELSQAELFSHKTQKDSQYFIMRFVKHPKFKYRFIGIYRKQKLRAFLVVRVVEINKSSVMRVVDIQGDLSAVSKVTESLHQILVNEGHEYLDIMQYGMEEEFLINSGFVKVEDSDDLIIPDYFQPFVQKNITIYFARQTAEQESSFVLFKGDADQDRPNVM